MPAASATWCRRACANRAKNCRSAFKGALQAGLGKLDLVTREEFDVQRAVLLRTREKLDALEQAVAALEARTPGTPPTAPPATP